MSLYSIVSVQTDAAHLCAVLAESATVEDKTILAGGRIADALDTEALANRFVALSSDQHRAVLGGAGFHTRHNGCR